MNRDVVAALRAIGLDAMSFVEAMRFIETAVGSDIFSRHVILRGSTRLGFPAAELERIEATPDGDLAMTVAAMGLTGALGALPIVQTEALQRLMRAKDLGLRDFLDIFNDRLLHLLYEVHAKYRLPVAYGRRERAAPDSITEVMLALIGLGLPGLRGRLGRDDELLLPFAAVFARPCRAAGDVAAVMAAITGWRIRVEPFHGQWVDLPVSEQSSLGIRREQHSRLGVDTIAGSRIFDLAGGVGVHVGPLRYPDFMALVSGGADARDFATLARFAIGPEFALTLEVILAHDDVPAFQLAQGVESGRRLGFDSWLGCPEGDPAVTPRGCPV
ncbi:MULTISPECIES: type VI secretion system baseplate subunit TssG [unclassified Chelatococcus]|uniref:type VI secretion system baseplate subunit TssG n=1 Tax=unclassified Chelatococcus TaxID=2638111 RepID=UPI001BCC9CAA|nr:MULTISPECIES: type VI secretion system baseplate subunit TssG [unclassified Chelatococcus]CAH1653439.1 Type VI secretion system protein ImpH [Hyphomicrobiales bacterium]MBS7740119.1 type VI secretion system baseplate subunit TssG [Chelatococcus sp. HY11]MBX3545052.1 type VI secretion system baseplate subunit TssG [Chelatococcus sp.]MCO5078581.1 type VI secretion system baseplate subunit TssG [Chelatococcus sp.]CAH1685702.1 Type VI secretion system protein ImpH [Hyphomicrobiales bacterium]